MSINRKRLWVWFAGSLIERYFDEAAEVVTGKETSTLSGVCDVWVAAELPRSNYEESVLATPI